MNLTYENLFEMRTVNNPLTKPEIYLLKDFAACLILPFVKPAFLHVFVSLWSSQMISRGQSVVG